MPNRQNLQHKTVYLVVAHDTRDGQNHPLNVLTSLEGARAECVRWQEQHRQWWGGVNRFNISVREAFLDKRGPGGLASGEETIVCADFE